MFSTKEIIAKKKIYNEIWSEQEIKIVTPPETKKIIFLNWHRLADILA
jgi:hypothetical protein